MNGFLSTIGLCAIVILIIYTIKKIDDYRYFKKEVNVKYKFDEDDDEL